MAQGSEKEHTGYAFTFDRRRHTLYGDSIVADSGDDGSSSYGYKILEG